MVISKLSEITFFAHSIIHIQKEMLNVKLDGVAPLVADPPPANSNTDADTYP